VKESIVMSSSRTKILAIGGVLGIFLVASTAFVVDQRQQALVLQLGKVRKVIQAPGLYFRIPVIENVVFLEKRILDLDLPEQEVIASDRKRLVVDAFSRYRVSDPVRFYQTVQNVVGAEVRLSSIVNSTMRAVLAEATFTAIVRSDRGGLMKRIREEVDEQAKGLGIDVIDVRLRRVDLPQQNSLATFQRMQTERQKEAAEIRAEGSMLSQEIKAKADRDATVIKAEAERTAQDLFGQGDAQSNRLYAQSYGKDPDFFSFYRSMQAYESSFQESGSRFLMSPKDSFFGYLQDPFKKWTTAGK
jgi:membrane protease subunit HflC